MKNFFRKLFTVIIGIAVIAGGLLFLSEGKGEYKKTSAVITDMKTRHTIDETETDVYVDFEVDGEKYTNVFLDSYDITMKIGKEINIEYDISNPNRIRTPGSKYIPYVLIAIGSVITVVGIVFIIRSKEDKNNSSAETKFDAWAN